MASFPSSYWVESGRLLAGAHPAFPMRLVPALRVLATLGVTGFVDLTETSDLEPYEHLLGREESAGVAPEYRRMAIRDFGVPARDHMTRTLDLIDAMLSADRIVYVHCLAGLGRTGTVVGCHLVRHGLPGKEALRQLVRLRRGLPAESPQTEEQCRFVREWPVGA